VENTGPTELGAVELTVSGLPSAVGLAVQPRTLRLAAGARGTFRLDASLGTTIAAGTYAAAVGARDAGSGATRWTAARLVRCRWRLARLAPGEETTLSFQAVVTGASPTGRARASATARSASGAAGPIDVDVEVTRNTLRPFGGIRGRVFYQGGGGVEGVRFLL